MALLDILTYPDPRLRQRARPVDAVDAQVRQLAEDMAQTMYAAKGIGLAATQVGVAKRVVVMDLSAEHDQLRVLINPRVVARDGSQECEEGCLSVPDVYDTVERALRVSTSTARRGKWTPTACWRCACNTRSTTWTASCSWTTCRA